ncbi:hypothetical protein LB507_005585 [Fusarium sp. FIESC RH6]|nr:hypothetical protein LB507_005585 [Fusarium sp. FIESC RH6]
MIAKTFFTAVLAASFMAGTHASPCKASSRPIDVSATVGISSTATSTEGSGTTQAISSTTDASSADDTTLTISQSDISSRMTSLEDVTTTTAVSTTDLSTIVVESSTEAPATTISTIDLISSVQETIVETSTASTDATSTAGLTTTEITTTEESTTTAESTTTTAEAPPAPTFLLNGGFDDELYTTAPWTRASGIITLSLSSTVKHDGRNSAELKYLTGGQSAIRQQLGVTPQAGVDYPLSAWFRPGVGCSNALIYCTYGNGLTSSAQSLMVSALVNQWVELSHTCNYSQAQIDAGGLQLYVGFICPRDAIAWIDSITFLQ